MVKEVLKSSKTKDVYQKFLSILDARPRIRDPAPIPKPRGDPPVPPGQVDPPSNPVLGNPIPNSGASSGSDWEPGKIPMDEEEHKSCFCTGILSIPNLPCLLPRYLIQSHLFFTRGQKQVRENWQGATPAGQEVSLWFMPGTPLWITLKGILP